MKWRKAPPIQLKTLNSELLTKFKMLSRVADSLYWMSRYLERVEHTARVVGVNLSMALEQSPEAANRRWQRVLGGLRARPPHSAGFHDASEVAYWLIFNQTNHNSLASCVHLARDNARQVREGISVEMWEHINRLYLRVREAREAGAWNENQRHHLSAIIETCHMIQGVTDSTLSHGEGWHFVQVGRYIERTSGTAKLLDVQFSELYNPNLRGKARRDESDTYLDWVALLSSCIAFDAYRKVHTAQLLPERIAEFLVFNGEFPHSVSFSAQELENSLKAIGKITRSHRATRVNNVAHRLRSTLRFSQPTDLLLDGLSSHLRYVLDGCGQIHHAIHQAYIAYPVEQELSP
ncbi:MAG TPA: alpha-E domain-containing protein [Abditibacteriaceae bacterium]|jgi:uncharacterized alpha-E superfamily protein